MRPVALGVRSSVDDVVTPRREEGDRLRDVSPMIVLYLQIVPRVVDDRNGHVDSDRLPAHTHDFTNS